MPLIILLGFATFISTYLGGLFSIRFKHSLDHIMSFTAGVLVGVVSFDLIPEMVEIVGQHSLNLRYAMIALVSGFLLFHILEKTILIHHSHEHDYKEHRHPHVGSLSAGALIIHSLMDGIGIGLGFQVNDSVGIAIALAIISHDFTDGMNTVTLMLTNKNSLRKARLFLIADSMAPIIGVMLSSMIKVPVEMLLLYLGFFTGFLLYIGASDILPEAHREKSSYAQIAFTIAGVVLIYFISGVLKV